jgi:hypothetical protein
VQQHVRHARPGATAITAFIVAWTATAFVACDAPVIREHPSGWTGVVTLQQIEELRSNDALLPLDADSIASLYHYYDPQTFYSTFGGRIRSLALLVDTLNRPLDHSIRLDTLSIDHTFENIGEAGVRGRTLFISSSYFYMYTSSEVCRSVVTHEFGHQYYLGLSRSAAGALDTAWIGLRSAALFYIFRDGEYSGNARFGGHPDESPAELFASAFNLVRNRPGELASRLLFVSNQNRRVTDHIITIVETEARQTRR